MKLVNVSFNNSQNSFQQTLRQAVDEYFEKKGISKTGGLRLYSKTIVLFTLAITSYLLLLNPSLPPLAGILLSIVLGLVIASIGFNVMHDACHGSYSRKKWVNEVLGLSINALGGNAFIWKFKHNVIHHTYTNIDGIDDDIAKSPLLRLCPSQPWKPAHRFQAFYVIAVYAISSLAWIGLLDFGKYFQGKIVNTPMNRMPVKEHLIFWVSKVLYLVFYMVIPVYFVGWKAWAIGFSLMHLTLGFTLAIVFQLAHVVEGTESEELLGHGLQIEEEWAIHQIRTTANFARDNKWISWYVGGLNFQVEHHLFPRISHIHYPDLSVIVKDTCSQFGVPYIEFPTMSEAIVSHFRVLVELGKQPAKVPA
jgi:linoleoyl-CoA desaturase